MYYLLCIRRAVLFTVKLLDRQIIILANNERERDAWRDQVNIRVRSVNFIELWWPLVLRAKL